ncbi:cysteine protease [Saccharomycopsis crataegensis]|uniref:Cysteine protease n=1 Tax=Saccharomycopsis crataegensis TaxID=43959 RepID=A0AAV5QJU4_9ASCO|nr:cysteine protease [Saccharomycopsis crataegensis]
MFLDKELEHEDTKNPLIVLGNSYPASTDTDSEDRPNSEEQYQVIEDRIQAESMVIVKQNNNNNDTDATQTDENHQSIPMTNNQMTGLNINDFKSKIQSNFNSLFNISKPDQIEPTALAAAGKAQQPNTWPKDFLDDVRTRLWLTYRVGFPSIPKDKNSPSTVMGALMRGNFADINSDGFSSDCGWGCMIRTSQSLLANTLLDLKVGRDWRFQGPNNDESWDMIHDNIVSWFVDDPISPFSIHNFVKKGSILCGKSSGEWFGPSAASRSIQALCDDFKDAGLNVYIGEDSGEIYEKDMLQYFQQGEDDKAVLILLGMRLGIDNVNVIYYSPLKQVLSLKQSVGIAGGRPSSSHYFFGYQDDYLFFLDPHVSNRPALKLGNNYDLSESVVTGVSQSNPIDSSTIPDADLISPTLLTNSDIESVHTTVFNKLHLSEMDPSMLIGFLIKNKSDWNSFKESVNTTDLKKIIHIADGSKNDVLGSQIRRSSLDVLTERNLVLVESEDGMGDEFVDLGAEFDNLSTSDGMNHPATSTIPTTCFSKKPTQSAEEKAPTDSSSDNPLYETTENDIICVDRTPKPLEPSIGKSPSPEQSEKAMNQTWENVSNHNASYEDLQGVYQQQDNDDAKVIVQDTDEDESSENEELAKESEVLTH